MSIRIATAPMKTAESKLTPWHWDTTPFDAFRGDGADYHASLHVGADFRPSFIGTGQNALDSSPSRLMVTLQKKTLQIVPCEPDKDQLILLVSLQSGLDGFFSRVEVSGGEVLYSKEGHAGQRCTTKHLAVRLHSSDGYVFSETGRRCGEGQIDFFCWHDQRSSTTADFEEWLELRQKSAAPLTSAIGRLRTKR